MRMHEYMEVHTSIRTYMHTCTTHLRMNMKIDHTYKHISIPRCIHMLTDYVHTTTYIHACIHTYAY